MRHQLSWHSTLRVGSIEHIVVLTQVKILSWHFTTGDGPRKPERIPKIFSILLLKVYVDFRRLLILKILLFKEYQEIQVSTIERFIRSYQKFERALKAYYYLRASYSAICEVPREEVHISDPVYHIASVWLVQVPGVQHFYSLLSSNVAPQDISRELHEIDHQICS